MVCHFVSSSDVPACSNGSGTARMACSVVSMTTGMDIIASVSHPATRLNPRPNFRTKIASPNSPKMMDGVPARLVMRDRTIWAKRPCPMYSASQTPPRMPTNGVIMSVPSMSRSEPRIIGQRAVDLFTLARSQFLIVVKQQGLFCNHRCSAIRTRSFFTARNRA